MQLAEKKKDDAEPAKNALTVAKDMIREEGPGSLYGGLSAAMARQAVKPQSSMTMTTHAAHYTILRGRSLPLYR
jgi:Mitochondrial carrier protein